MSRIHLTEDQMYDARPCPDGCGCAYPSDPDANDCGCDGPCTENRDWFPDTPDYPDGRLMLVQSAATEKRDS